MIQPELVRELEQTCEQIARELKQHYENETLGEWWESNVLSCRYTCDNNGNFVGADICIGMGGPAYWVNTKRAYVEGYWGENKAEHTIPYDVSEALDDMAEDEWRAIYDYWK